MRTSRSGSNWKVKTRWILGAWAVLSAVSALGTALTPTLLAFPMVLVAFTPRLPFLILAATSANPVLFFCVAVPRMLVADPIHIALGRRYGGRFVPDRARRLMLPPRAARGGAAPDEQGARRGRGVQAAHLAGAHR